MHFTQGEQEPFYEAWERFSELLQKFPHHGIIDTTTKTAKDDQKKTTEEQKTVVVFKKTTVTKNRRG